MVRSPAGVIVRVGELLHSSALLTVTPAAVETVGIIAADDAHSASAMRIESSVRFI
jgi:hypothetical protein